MLVSGFRKRGLVNGVSPFVSENETEENGKEEETGKSANIGARKKKPKRNKSGNEKKKKQNGKKEENGKKAKSEATPFRRLLLRNPDCSDSIAHFFGCLFFFWGGGGIAQLSCDMLQN